jgi:threonine/homoserine/homoserine lactone efflux protein
MAEAIGSVLPLAVGVALSPMPIVAVVLMLVTRQARVNGPVFVLGWVAGLAAVGAVVLVFAGPADAGTSDEPATWVSVVELVLGALLLLVAVRQWRARPQGDHEPPMPGWMRSIDGFTPLKAGAAGVVLSALNPKNLLLAAAAAASIAQTDISASEQAVAYGVFAVIGTVGVAAPVVMYFALGDRAPELLEDLKTWMARNNAVIVAVLCLVIGAKLIGDAIGGL